MADLFQRTGLQQDTGLLSERWQQEGATLINATVTDGTNTTAGTIYTVSTGKIFYCKTMIISKINMGAMSINILDNATAKGSLASDSSILYETFTLTFDVPMAFTTSVKVSHTDTGAFGNVAVTALGWEERAP